MAGSDDELRGIGGQESDEEPAVAQLQTAGEDSGSDEASGERTASAKAKGKKAAKAKGKSASAKASGRSAGRPSTARAGKRICTECGEELGVQNPFSTLVRRRVSSQAALRAVPSILLEFLDS